MEKTGILINRLTEQYNNHATAEQLKISAQLLLGELQLREPEVVNEYAKVSVIFPAVFVVDVPETIVAEPEKELQLPPTITADEPVPEEIPMAKDFLVKKEEQQATDDYDAMMEIPTLAMKQQEINDMAAVNGKSLNDQLKASSSYKDVGSSIKDLPVKDLRKAIGINDRYVFINELFRGDQTMYERSIKTINGFNIYGEAEYWIKRELKLKLGWDDKTEAVQLFDELVKRRFS